MSISSRLVRYSMPILNRYSGAKTSLKAVDAKAARALHSAASILPALIRPAPRQLTIAVTAHCNLRCATCRYGRDFMSGEQLSLEEVTDAIADARSAGVMKIRFYGGEPLLHKDLPKMVSVAKAMNIFPYVTTNGILLRQKIDDLYSAGLRQATIGFYGFDVEGTPYAGRRNYSESLTRSLEYVREHYGSEVELQLNFVAMGPTCRSETWREAWQLAKKYDMFFHIDLFSYSTPFFVNDGEEKFAVTSSDEAQLRKMVAELLTYKADEPGRFLHSTEFIRSIPDWLLLGAAMKVPCDANQQLWIGADGTVQLCDTAFVMGNIRKQRLKDMLFSEAHRKASVDAFQLNCPNCTCRAEGRIQKHSESMRKYHG